jgi:hypothetical protein
MGQVDMHPTLPLRDVPNDALAYLSKILGRQFVP